MVGNLYLQLLPTNTETVGKPRERFIQVDWNVLGFYKLNHPSLLTDLIFKKKNMFTTSKKKCKNSEKSKNL